MAGTVGRKPPTANDESKKPGSDGDTTLKTALDKLTAACNWRKHAAR
jgi:hypothetical protein